jgi:hypothetical protein
VAALRVRGSSSERALPRSPFKEKVMTMDIKKLMVGLVAMSAVVGAAAAASAACQVPLVELGTFEDPLICDDLVTGARGAAFGAPLASITVDLNGRNTNVTFANSQGYTANGIPLPGCLAEDTDPVPGRADTQTEGCEEVEAQDLFVQ